MADKLIVYGADWCADCVRAKDILATNNVEYEYKDTDDAEVHAEMLKLTEGKDEIPTLLFPDGKVVQNPDNAELQELIGVKPAEQQQVRDVIIVGAGPAALTAAIYTTREDIDTLLF